MTDKKEQGAQPTVMMMQMVAAFAEFERAMLKEHTQEAPRLAAMLPGFSVFTQPRSRVCYPRRPRLTLRRAKSL
jgi:hypothetical protein